MTLLISIVVTFVVVVALVVGISAIMSTNIKRKSKQEKEIMFESFGKKHTSSIVRSKFFPDHLYVGKTVKLDPSIKLMLKDSVAGFSSDPLIVKGFKYFKVDQNEFEQVDFDKVGAKDFMMLYDSFEKQIYFLNRLTSQSIANGETPPMASQDVMRMNENNVEYYFNDFSGLIEVRVNNPETGMSNNRLIRVYNRQLTPEDDEFLVCIIDGDKPDLCHYYAGFNINIEQLENLS